MPKRVAIGRKTKGKQHKKNKRSTDEAASIPPSSAPVTRTRQQCNESASTDESASQRDDQQSDSFRGQTTCDEHHQENDSDGENDSDWEDDTGISSETLCYAEGYDEEGSVLPDISLNLAIAYLFVEKFQVPEPEQWDGKHGVAVQIRNLLGLHPNSTRAVKKVLRHVWACDKCGFVYSGAPLSASKRGPEPRLGIDTVEAAMVASAVESGLSFQQTVDYVNTCFVAQADARNRDEQNGEEGELMEEQSTTAATFGNLLITYHQVQSLVKRLNPFHKRIGTQGQGSSNPESPWARARLNWTTQLLLRFGWSEGISITRTRQNTAGELETFVPDCFDKDKLTPCQLDRTAFFDETHRKCIIGGKLVKGGKNENITLLFPRDENDNLDPNGNHFRESPIKPRLNVKYDKETRLLLGVAATKHTGGDDDDDETENWQAHRLPIFSYSGKTVVSIEDMENAEIKQISHVRRLRHGGPWLDAGRNGNRLYIADQLTFIHKKPTYRIASLGPKNTTKLSNEGVVKRSFSPKVD